MTRKLPHKSALFFVTELGDFFIWRHAQAAVSVIASWGWLLHERAWGWDGWVHISVVRNGCHIREFRFQTVYLSIIHQVMFFIDKSAFDKKKYRCALKWIPCLIGFKTVHKISWSSTYKYKVTWGNWAIGFSPHKILEEFDFKRLVKSL